MTVNIEHVNIDDETEIWVEMVLTIAKEYVAFDLTGRDSDLHSGNVLEYLDDVMSFGEEALRKAKGEEIIRLNVAMRRITDFRNLQSYHFNDYETFMAWPTSKYGPLSKHLKG